jgi:hypothetical protein
VFYHGGVRVRLPIATVIRTGVLCLGLLEFSAIQEGRETFVRIVCWDDR